MKSLNFKVGLFLVGSMVFMALLAPWLSPHDPDAYLLPQKFVGPNADFWFGHDSEGRCLLSRIFFGARVSLIIALSVVSISMIVGVFLGVASGWLGGWFDMLFLFVSDLFLAFPGFLLAIAVAAFLPASITNIIFVLSLAGWVGYARLVRGQVLELKNREYILAAQVMGVSWIRLVFKYLIPNLMGPLTIQATFGMAGVVLVESALNFLGLGVPPEVPSWGGMLDQGTQFLLIAPHLSIFPGVFIMLFVLGFNFLGDGLRDRLDPRHKVQEAL